MLAYCENVDVLNRNRKSRSGLGFKVYASENDDLESRRKQRLGQVRSQAKEIAANIRKNVIAEKKKQLKRVEQIKADELNAWKKKNLQQINREYKECVSQVGQAHAAVAEDELFSKNMMRQMAHHHQMARERGKIAANKLKPRKIKTKSVATQSESLTIPDANVSQTKTEPPKLSLTTRLNTIFENPESNFEISSSEYHHLIDKHKKSPEKKIFEETANSKLVNEKDDLLEERINSEVMDSNRPHFTQISELLRRKESLTSKSGESVRTVRFDEKIESLRNDPLKTLPTSNVITAPLHKSPSNKSQKSSKTKIVKAMDMKSDLDKVQMYDHWSRFAKEYVPSNNLVTRHEINSSVPSAIDLARRELEEERLRQIKIDEMNATAAKRSEQAITKDRLKKDYDLLVNQLEGLTKEEQTLKKKKSSENIHNDVMGTEKEKKLNTIFEDIAQRQTLITCPPITDNPSAQTKSPYITSLNVAGGNQIRSTATRTNSPPYLPEVHSSDSSTSIILGKVDEINQTSSPSLERDPFKLKEFRLSKNDVENTGKIQELIDLLRKLENGELLQKSTTDRTSKSISTIVDREPTTSNVQKKTTSRSDRIIQTEIEVEDVLSCRNNGKVSIDVPLKIVVRVQGENQPIEVKPTFKQPDPKVLIKDRFEKQSTRQSKSTKTKQLNRRVLDDSSASTQYRSPPLTIRTELDRMVNDGCGPSGRHENPKPQLNKDLSYYITKLLNMSRHSIDSLPVSDVSSVSTPGSSVIYNDLNMDRINQFLSENYSLASEIDESLRSKCIPPTVVTQPHTKKQRRTKTLEKNMKTVNRQVDELLKEVVTTKSTKQPVFEDSPAHDDDLSNVEQELVTKYNQLTENCSKRIADLAKMISSVRTEKKNLLENSNYTATSSSSGGRNSTEYLELNEHITRQMESEQLENIKKMTKNLGASRDSGIGHSRPVTSSDIHETSETRPISADSIIGVVEREPVVGTQIRHTKPPPSISRYSPHLNDVKQHELSTITEIETPATSKLIVSERIEQKNQTPSKPIETVQVSEHDNENLDNLFEISRLPREFEKFPSFSSEKTDETQKNLSTLFDVTNKSNFQYQKFASLSTFDPSHESETRELQQRQPPDATQIDKMFEMSTAKKNLEYNKFPSFSQFEKSNNESDVDGDHVPPTSSSSNSSLPDVVAELMRRKIITEPFDNSPSKKKSGNGSEGSNKRNFADHLFEDTDSVRPHSEKLEKELQEIGLGWMSTLLKRTEQSDRLQSSSSSQSLGVSNTTATAPTDEQKKTKPSSDIPIKRFLNFDDSSLLETAKKPQLNLKNFVVEELRKSNARPSDSQSSTETSSLASMLLKSLLASSPFTPETSGKVHKTSTPVTRSSKGDEKSTDHPTSTDMSSALFSGESRLSSVKNDRPNTSNLVIPDDKLKHSSI